jgi:hypothetical protein
MKLTGPQNIVAKDTSRFKVLITGRRFGKTHLSIRELCKAAANKPGSINWYISPSYRMSKQIVWLQLVDKLSQLRWIDTKNEAELTIRLKNKSVIALKGADNFDSLRGVGLDFVIIDEFQDVPEQAWKEVIRPTLSDKQGRAMFAGTPRGVGSWSHELYTFAQHNPGWKSWTFTTIQGGNVPAEEIESARRDLDPKTFAQEYEATFNTYSGTVYYNFDNATIQPLKEEDHNIIHVGMDFNYDPFAIVIAQVKGNHVHIFDEIMIRGSSTEDAVDEIKARYPHSRVVVYPDPAAKQKKTSAGGKTDLSILVNAGFTVKVRQFHTPVRDRVNAVNAKLRNAAGERTLLVSPKCKNTIDSLQRLTYKEGTSQIDKDSGLDHMCDAVGYLTDYLFPIKVIHEVEEPARWTFGATTATRKW